MGCRTPKPSWQLRSTCKLALMQRRKRSPELWRQTSRALKRFCPTLKRQRRRAGNRSAFKLSKNQLDKISYVWSNYSNAHTASSDTHALSKLKLKMMDLDAEIDMVHHDLSLAKSQLAVITATGTERQISGATEVKMTAEKLLARKMAEKAELTAQIVTTENAVMSQQIEVSAHVPAQKFLPNKVGVNASTGAEIYQEVLDAAQKVEDVQIKINAAKAREQSALKNAASDRLTAVAASNAKQAAEVAKAEGMMLSLDLKKAEERLKLITSESKNAQEMIFVGSIKESVRNIIKEAVLRNEAIRGPAYASPLEKYHPSATRTPLSIKFEKMLVNLHFIRKARTGKAAVSVLWVQSHRKKFEDALRTDMSYALEISKDNILINYISAAETKMPKNGLGGGTVVDVTILGGLPADVSVVDNQLTWREVNAVYGMA